jgi:hypothetical protein
MADIILHDGLFKLYCLVDNYDAASKYLISVESIIEVIHDTIKRHACCSRIMYILDFIVFIEKYYTDKIDYGKVDIQKEWFLYGDIPAIVTLISRTDVMPIPLVKIIMAIAFDIMVPYSRPYDHCMCGSYNSAYVTNLRTIFIEDKKNGLELLKETFNRKDCKCYCKSTNQYLYVAALAHENYDVINYLLVNMPIKSMDLLYVFLSEHKSYTISRMRKYAHFLINDAVLPVEIQLWDIWFSSNFRLSITGFLVQQFYKSGILPYSNFAYELLLKMPNQ